jgi:hypothetical protein
MRVRVELGRGFENRVGFWRVFIKTHIHMISPMVKCTGVRVHAYVGVRVRSIFAHTHTCSLVPFHTPSGDPIESPPPRELDLQNNH